MADNKFVPGFRIFLPRENAPEWVKADILIDVRQMRDWLADNPHNEVRLQIKESRDSGKLYATVNDYTPGTQTRNPAPPPPRYIPPQEMTTNRAYNHPPLPQDDLSDDSINDIPF